ncbi:MAG: membrane protein insertase YidC [Alteraurantiacibacter sp.]
MSNQRNLILAIVLSLGLLFGWQFLMERFYPPEEVPVAQAAVTSQETVDAPAAEASVAHNLAAELANPARVKIDAPLLEGSINLVGARVDDIEFRKYRESIARDSGPVQFMAPLGTAKQHFARFDWVGEGVAVPGPQTVWTSGGGTLTPTTPVKLSWNNGQGQLFELTFSIDEHYMISVEQAVSNLGNGSIALRPRALINRTSLSADRSNFNVHSGPLAAIDGAVDFDWDYDEVSEELTKQRAAGNTGALQLPGRPGWIGFTDIYWMSALIPQPGAPSLASIAEAGTDKYAAVLLYDTVTVPAGRKIARTTRLFAGAKESAVLNAYQDQGVEQFGLAIDWGWFRFIVKPMEQFLLFLFGITKNFGLAIILLTVVVRGLMFPIANKQFASMAQMRAVQPKMKALQERHKEDKGQLQQEMAKLYKEEKINPLAGCLPIFLQMPIFFALYKSLRVAVEMRHQPFYAWIHDLSAPDPLHILNLFGLLDFTPTSFLAIGPLAVLLGLTMWLQFKLNPAATDPMQQQVFMIMPWMMMFVMAPFAAGLLIYWITSNILTVAQQKYLYSRHPQLKAQAAAGSAQEAG